MGFLLATGLVSMLGQVVLFRELNAAFSGVELIYLLALGAWLIWTAVGAFVRPPRSSRRSPAAIEAAFAALGILLALDVAFLRAARRLLGGVPGAYLPFPRQLLVLTLALLPVGVLLGLLFHWSARRYVGPRRTLARAYAIESAGALLAGVAATALLKAGVQTFTLAVVTSLVALCAALVRPAVSGSRAARAGLGFLTIVALALVPRSQALDRRLAQWDQPGLVETRDSPYARLSIVDTAGQRAVFENGALMFETESADAETFAHLVALQHPAPARILVLGGGPEGLGPPLLQHHPAQLDDVEIDRVLVDLVSREVPQAMSTPPGAAAVRTIIEDPRTFLRHAGVYDLILVGTPDLSSGAANRFFTREFFAQCAARLAPGGVVGLRLRSAENYWTPAEAARVESVYRALRFVFGDVVVLPGSTNVVLASASPLSRDPTVLVNRLARRGITARLVSPPYVRYLYTSGRRIEIARILEASDAAPNTDARPICYQFSAIIWLGRFWPAVARLDPTRWAASANGRLGGWLFVAGVPLVFLLGRWRPSRRRWLLVASAGLVGMALETVLILHFQLKEGVLFEDLGALLASFMAGLAAGALAIDRAVAPRGPRKFPRQPTRAWGVALALAFALVAAACAAFVGSGVSLGLAGSALALAATGALVAAVFAYASLRDVADPTHVIAPLYAADLAGGAAGALVATLLLIPLVGLPLTAWWAAIVAVATVLLV